MSYHDPGTYLEAGDRSASMTMTRLNGSRQRVTSIFSCQTILSQVEDTGAYKSGSGNVLLAKFYIDSVTRLKTTMASNA